MGDFFDVVSVERRDRSSVRAAEVSVPEQRLKFADVLFPQVRAHLGKWATGASSFVVVNLLEEGAGGLEAGKRKEAVKILQGQRKELEKAREGRNKGAGMVLEKLGK